MVTRRQRVDSDQTPLPGSDLAIGFHLRSLRVLALCPAPCGWRGRTIRSETRLICDGMPHLPDRGRAQTLMCAPIRRTYSGMDGQQLQRRRQQLTPTTAMPAPKTMCNDDDSSGRASMCLAASTARCCQVAYQASSFWLKSAVAGGIAAGSIAALAVTWPIYLINSMASLDNAWLVVARPSRSPPHMSSPWSPACVDEILGQFNDRSRSIDQRGVRPELYYYPRRLLDI